VADTLIDLGRSSSAIEIMGDRLERAQDRPLAVAFSGGADSLLLLLTAKAWADAARRRVVAVTVDHGLQPSSRDWALWCQGRARRLGVDHQVLSWQGPKPQVGLPAAARTARHRLVAEHARSVGACVVLMGHTADDALEAGVMRASGSSTTQPRAWAPSPIWPEGRGVFLLRPLVRTRRADIRALLAAAGEEWIEDPSNADKRYARSRARDFLEAAPPEWPAASMERDDKGTGGLLDTVVEDEAGTLRIPCELLRARHRESTQRAVASAVVSVSGAARPPRRGRLRRLLMALEASEPFVATLAGARIEAQSNHIVLLREPGEMRRGTCTLSFALTPGQSVTWDGRFQIEAREEGLTVRPLAGVAGRLRSNERVNLGLLAPAARKTLPAIVDSAGRVSCPILACDHRVEIGRLVFARLVGACGGVHDEAALRRMAEETLAS
jgi:tRNA(Ile)-lysidine synthase